MTADPMHPLRQNQRPYRIVTLNYVSLYVKNFSEATCFYSQVFGMPESADANGANYGWRMGSTG
jgi:catechol-2,3-dioxygenase